ncbi:MAG TPA: hypothetical protein DEH78_09860, partial [Solibacterales bacterium]|nr:hypothetical protein [Bryobacterales bacterium]
MRWLAGLLLAGTLHAQLPAPPAWFNRLEAAERRAVREAWQAGDRTAVRRMLAERAARTADAEIYAWLGQSFFQSGETMQAGIAFAKADAIQPLNDADRFTLAMCYVALAMPERAGRELRRLPETPLHIYWLARLDYDAQQFERALEGFRKALAADPGFSRAYDNLGLSLEALGRNEEAIEAYGKAMAGEGCPAWPRHNLGVLQRKLGRLEAAEGALRDAVRCDPNFAKAHHQLGLVLEALGRTDEAMSAQRRAVAIDPALPEPHYSLSLLLRRAGKMAEAVAELEEFRKAKGRTAG